MNYSQDMTGLPVSQAAELWFEQRRHRIKESTIDCYRDYLKRLTAYFDKPLNEIHIGHVLEYQARMKKKYHPDSVNHDLNLLKQIMAAAGLWAPLAEHYRPLPKPEVDPPKVMSDSQEDEFFEFAARSKWALAYMVGSLTNNSTASGKELRYLRLDAIDMNADPRPTFRVPKNMKNPNRPRTITLNERGAIIMDRLLRRAAKLGSTSPEHYLFPRRIKRNLFDPTKPASESWLKYQWKKLISAAMLHTDPNCEHIGKVPKGEKCPSCKRGVLPFKLVPHNLRHQIITKLIDNGTPLEMVRQIAGHGVDSVATRIYYHARLEKMANALDAIDPDKKRPAAFSASKRGKGAINAG